MSISSQIYVFTLLLSLLVCIYADFYDIGGDVQYDDWDNEMNRNIVPFVGKRQGVISHDSDYFWPAAETNEYKTDMFGDMNIERRTSPWGVLAGSYRWPSSRPIVPFYTYSDPHGFGGSGSSVDKPYIKTNPFYGGHWGRILSGSNDERVFGRYPTRSRPTQRLF